MKEKVVAFGEDRRLSGVLALPGEVEPKCPAIVILNSGLIHRVGASRVSVKLARGLAADGNPALRFDFSGIGDSGPRPSGVSLDEGHLSEIQDSFDFLESEVGCREFILYGLCSGARDAFNTALADPRVVGFVQIDGFAYRTRKYYRTHYGRRIVDPRAWVEFISNRIKALRAQDMLPSEASAGEDMVLEVWPEYPPRETVAQGYRELVARGVRFLVLFTGSWDDLYNYPGQFFDMYPGVEFGRSLRLRYMPGAVHTLPRPDVQAEVLDAVREWVRSEEWNRPG